MRSLNSSFQARVARLYRRRLPLAAALLGALLAGAAPAPTPKSAATKAPSALRKIVAAVDGEALRSGGSGRIRVTVTLAPEFHVNSHTPSQEYLIATSIETSSADGLEIGAWKYPEGEHRRFAFSEESIQVYEGSFRIEGEIKAPASLPPSQRDVRLLLKYQACTADRCYPPRKEPIALAVRVVAAPAGASATPSR